MRSWMQFQLHCYYNDGMSSLRFSITYIHTDICIIIHVYYIKLGFGDSTIKKGGGYTP